MASIWKKLDTGIRAKVHPTRKHGIKPDLYFMLRYSVEGIKKQEALGWSSEGWTLAKAKAELIKLKEAQRTGEGEVTLADKRAKAKRERAAEQAKTDLTFEYVFYNGYRTYQENSGKKPSSLRSELGILKNYLIPFFGNTPLRAIDNRKVDDFIAYLRKTESSYTKKTLSDASKRHCLGLISQIFNYAITRHDTTLTNPIKLTKKPRSDNRRMRFLSVVEAKELLERLVKRSQDIHDVALLSIFCGLRAGEILNLHWPHINFDDRTIYIKDPKNKCSRYAYMTDEIETMLLKRQEQRGEESRSDKIFKSDGISKTFERVVLELGFNENITDPREKVVFHTLRHTFASWHAKAGTPLYTISKLLGHKSITMTERYAHLCPDAEKKAAMTLQGVMDDTKGGKIIAFARET